jgi:hypothetical protein
MVVRLEVLLRPFRASANRGTKLPGVIGLCFVVVHCDFVNF